METHRFLLTPNAPFSFAHVLESLRISAGTVLEVVTATEFRRAVYLNGRPALIVACNTGSVDSPQLEVEVTAESLDATLELAAQGLVARIFATDVDVAGLESVFREDAVMWQAWQRCRGFRPVVLPDLFETIAWAIIGQQITVAFAAKCKRAFTELCGAKLSVDGADYLLFPRPEAVAELEEADLLAIQFSRQKARYVINLARLITTGAYDLEALWSMTHDEVVASLRGLLGIGRWTAEYVAMRGLGHTDSLPAGDVALQRAVGMAYFGRMATEAEVRELGERWQPWRSYATACWWFGLRLDAVAKAAAKKPPSTALTSSIE